MGGRFKVACLPSMAITQIQPSVIFSILVAVAFVV
jgi:hypothetical protein